MFDKLERIVANGRVSSVSPAQVLRVAFVYVLDPQIKKHCIPALTDVGLSTCTRIATYLRQQMARYIEEWQVFCVFEGEIEADETAVRKTRVEIEVRRMYHSLLNK